MLSTVSGLPRSGRDAAAFTTKAAASRHPDALKRRCRHMPDLPPAELRAMARSIDESLQPRVRIALDVSAEGAQRLHDMLSSVTADLGQHAGIETSWPLYRMLAALEEAAAST
jgi:hypothetical protein